ncbi:MAG: hypothetical protein JST46_15055 [Bacteroidetes bacterium]|nr:hypothetical protein [Bacteroidota bacterium]
MASPNINISQPGYVYIYLSNEETTPVEVYFDDFKVTQTKSPVVSQQDYYPFGLSFNQYQRESSLINKFKFQSQEHVDDLGLNWDSFKWRNHQPDIGRFFNIDPLAEKYVYNSPYAFAENRVIDGRELEGLEWAKSIDTKTSTTTFTVTMKVKNSANLPEGSMYSAAFGIGKQVEESFKGTDESGMKYQTKVNLDFDSQIDTKKDFYLDLVPQVEAEGAPADALGAVDNIGDTNKNRIQVVVSANRERNEGEITRSGAHEVGHTGGLHHPESRGADKDRNGIKLESDNLMRQSSESNGTKINGDQMKKVSDTIDGNKRN